jgi:hypothetical protein
MKQNDKRCYGTGAFHVLANVCTTNHYYVLSIIFNSENKNLFESI